MFRLLILLIFISTISFADFIKMNPQSNTVSFDLKNGSNIQISYSLKNTGLSTDSFTAILSGSNASLFKVSLNRCLNILPNKSCAITLTANKGILVGEYSFLLGNFTQNVSIVNTGVVVAPPTLVSSAKILIQPTDVSFLTEKNKSVSYSILNDGQINIPSISVQMTTNQNNAVVILNRCSTSLAKGRSCTISYKFNNPNVGNTHNQVLKIFDGATEKKSYSFQINGQPGIPQNITYQIGQFSNWSNCSAIVCEGSGTQTRTVSRCDKYLNGVLNEQNVPLINCLGLEIGQVSQNCQSPEGSRTIDYLISSNVGGVEEQFCTQGSTNWTRTSLTCSGESDNSGIGYHKEGIQLSEQICEENTQNCSDSSIASGVKIWNGSNDYGTCSPSSCVGELNVDGSGYHLDNGSCVSNSRVCSSLPQYAASGVEIWDSQSSQYGSCSNIVCSQGSLIDGSCSNYISGVTLMNNFYTYYQQQNYFCQADSNISQILSNFNLGPNETGAYIYSTNAISMGASPESVYSIDAFAYDIGERCGNISLANTTIEKNYYSNSSNFFASGPGYFLRLLHIGGFPSDYMIYVTPALRSSLIGKNFTQLNIILDSIKYTANQGTYPKNSETIFKYANNPAQIISTQKKIYYLGVDDIHGYPRSLYSQNKGRDDSILITQNNENRASIYDRSLFEISNTNDEIISIAELNNKLIYSGYNQYVNPSSFIRSIDESGNISDIINCTTCSNLYGSTFKKHNGRLFVSFPSTNFKMYELVESNGVISANLIFTKNVSGQDVLAYAKFHGDYIYYYDHENSAKMERVNLNTLVKEQISLIHNSSNLNYRFYNLTFFEVSNKLVALVKNPTTNNYYFAVFNDLSDSFDVIDLNVINSGDGVYWVSGSENVMFFKTVSGTSTYSYSLKSFDGTSFVTLENENCDIHNSFVNSLNDNLFIRCSSLNDYKTRIYNKDGFVSNLSQNLLVNNYIFNGLANQTIINTMYSDFKPSIVYKNKQYFNLLSLEEGYNILYRIDLQNNLEIVSGGNCLPPNGSSIIPKIYLNYDSSMIVEEDNLYFSGTTCRGQSLSINYDPINGSENLGLSLDNHIYELLKLYIP